MLGLLGEQAFELLNGLTAAAEQLLHAFYLIVQRRHLGAVVVEALGQTCVFALHGGDRQQQLVDGCLFAEVEVQRLV